MTVGNDWDWRTPHIQRAPREPRSTPYYMAESAKMANGEFAEFCNGCGKLAYCPQCNADLRGKTVCHVSMSTHYRDAECNFNSNWMTEYKREESK